MPFPAIVEWYGPYDTLSALHEKATNDQWEYGLYMALGEHGNARYIGWTVDGLATKVTNVDHPEHNVLLEDGGNTSYYLGYAYPDFGGKTAQNNTGSNAARALIRALLPELNNPDNYPNPPAGNNCCVSVFSCFYGADDAHIDPPPAFPVVVTYNPYAQENNWIRIEAVAPQWQLLIDTLPDNPDP